MSDPGRATGIVRHAGQLTSRLLLLPRVAWIGMRTPRDHLIGWQRYWSKVSATGVGGDVLWDTGDLDEMPQYLALMRRHLDLTLPIVDIGCGNGRFTRRLTEAFPAVLGVDLAEPAVNKARSDWAGISNLEFMVTDATDPGAGQAIRDAVGSDANVFVRGVFHILDSAERPTAARTVATVLGSRGRLLLSETNFLGSQLGYMTNLGASIAHIPEPLLRAIVDLPRPGHFGAPERAVTFPDRDWELIEDGAVEIETIPMDGSMDPGVIPGYVAVLAPRSAKPATGG